MTVKSKFIMLFSGLALLLFMGGAAAQEAGEGAGELGSTLTQIKDKAGKVETATGRERASARRELLQAVNSAIAKAKGPEEIAAIIAAAMTSAPSQAAEITGAAVAAAPAQAATIAGAAVKALPSQAAAITRAAVAAAPSQSVAITVAAVNSAPNQSPVIVRSAIAATSHDSTTVATLQSLVTTQPRGNPNVMPNQPGTNPQDNLLPPPPAPPATGGQSASPA